VIFKGEYDKTFPEGDLADFPGPARLRKVDETPREAPRDHPSREYRYPGSENMIGSRVKHLTALGDGPVAAMGSGSAAREPGPADLFVCRDGETGSGYLPSLHNNNG
jgi:hypothetical protein